MSEQINCPVCGKPNNADTNYCANCGEHLALADHGKVTKYRSPAIKYLIIAVLVFSVIAGFSQYGSAPKTDNIPPGYVKISAKLYKSELTISNASDFDLENVEIILNPDSSMKGHSLKVDSIKAGDTIVTDVGDYTKKSGSRFSTLSANLTDIAIKCDTPKGPVTWESNGDLEIID